MQKIVPWVDITCGRCGCLADSSGYYYKGIITKLKQETKSWRYDNTYGNLCPGCQQEIEREFKF